MGGEVSTELISGNIIEVYSLHYTDWKNYQ